MRITGGKDRGRKLSVPKGLDIRPTTDKVRQAVFNILLSYDLPQGVRVLDLFCGTGSLGMEALSRGASHCIFIDKDISCVRNNLESIGWDKETYSVFKKSALKAGPLPVAQSGASLVFCDPPYRKDMVVPALENMTAQGWFAEGALCVIECEKDCNVDLPKSFASLDQRRYGDVQIIIARYK